MLKLFVFMCVAFVAYCVYDAWFGEEDYFF